MGLLNPFDRSDDDSSSEQPPANEGRSVETEITNAKKAVRRLVSALRERNLRYEHRDEIAHQYRNVLDSIHELVGDNHIIHWIAPDEGPTTGEMADLISDAANGIDPKYFDTANPIGPLRAIQKEAVRLEQLVTEKPEFKYAYEETGRKSVYSHEVQSFGVPHDIDPERLPEGEDGEEVYSCGRALEMMEDLAEDPKCPLWLGLGTRNGRDVGIEKDVLFRHRAIFGQTGYGKSTLLTNDARQLIESGAGMCFIDPKGDDSKRLMKIIPEERLDDVIWIEPGSSGEYLSGFNYISMAKDPDDPGYEVARANLVDDLKKMLKMSAEYWGPRMDRVAMNLITAMNMYNDRTPDDAPEMNLVDLYEILESEASRREFAARAKKARIHFVDDYTQDIAEMDDEDLEPLLGRFVPWIQNPVARRMIGFRAGGVNIPEAIDNDKIIIVRMGAEPRDLKQMLGMAVIRRIWSHIRSRSAESIYERKPFYLFVDEFDNIALEDDTIPSIISESRSMRLSFNVANQYPKQLPDNVVDAITTNCDTIISFNPGDKKSAKAYNTQLGLDPETLTEEVNYHVWLRTTLKANMEKSEAFRAYVFPPFPPLRTGDEAQAWINKSLKEFGRRRRSDEQVYQNLLFNNGDGRWETGIGKEIAMAEDDEMKMALEAQLLSEMPPPESPAIGSSSGSGTGGASSGGGDSDLTPEEQFVEDQKKTILESIFATALQNGKEPTEYVPTALVKEELKTRLPDDTGTSLSELSNMFETMDFDLIDLERVEGKSQVRLTKRGEAKVFDHDTGSAGSGGGDDHRWVLRESYVAFTKLGYHTWLPEQDGGELPDGVGEAPIDITAIDSNVSPNEFAEKIEENKQRLQEEYPAVWNLAGANDLSIEAETSTIKYPFQTFHNLRKAKERGDLCVFAVKSMSAEKDDFAYWARRGEQAIFETKGTGHATEIVDDSVSFRKRDKKGRLAYYNQGSTKYQIESGETALRPKTSEKGTYWYYDSETGEVVCAPATNGVIPEDADEIRFESEEAAVRGVRTAVPAYYEYDRKESEYVVYTGGEKLHYPTEEEMTAEWEPFNRPFIPEAEFDEMPTKDDFIIVIFPDKDSEYDQPQIYDRGELTPLFDSLGADLTMPELGELDAVDDEPAQEGRQDEEEQATKGRNPNDGGEPRSEEATSGQPTGDHEPEKGGTASPTISPQKIASHGGNDYTPAQIASFATGTVLPTDNEFDRFVAAVEAIDPNVAAAIDEPDDIPGVVGVPTLEEEFGTKSEESPGGGDTDGGSDSAGEHTEKPTAECPGCGSQSTFSESGQWGSLSCDSCGYTPKASVRGRIKNGVGEEESAIDPSGPDSESEPSGTSESSIPGQAELDQTVADGCGSAVTGQSDVSEVAQERKGSDSVDQESAGDRESPSGIAYDCPACDQERLFSRDQDDVFTCNSCGHEPIRRVQNHLRVESRLPSQSPKSTQDRPSEEPESDAEPELESSAEPPQDPKGGHDRHEDQTSSESQTGSGPEPKFESEPTEATADDTDTQLAQPMATQQSDHEVESNTSEASSEGGNEEEDTELEVNPPTDILEEEAEDDEDESGESDESDSDDEGVSWDDIEVNPPTDLLEEEGDDKDESGESDSNGEDESDDADSDDDGEVSWDDIEVNPPTDLLEEEGDDGEDEPDDANSDDDGEVSWDDIEVNPPTDLLEEEGEDDEEDESDESDSDDEGVSWDDIEVNPPTDLLEEEADDEDESGESDSDGEDESDDADSDDEGVSWDDIEVNPPTDLLEEETEDDVDDESDEADSDDGEVSWDDIEVNPPTDLLEEETDESEDEPDDGDNGGNTGGETEDREPESEIESAQSTIDTPDMTSEDTSDQDGAEGEDVEPTPPTLDDADSESRDDKDSDESEDPFKQI